jgi:FdhD protein
VTDRAAERAPERPLGPSHPLYAGASRSRPVVRLGEGGRRAAEAEIAEEVPVAMVFDGRSHVVMMATPDDLEDFAVGFAVAEGIVASATDVRRVAVVRHAQGIELQIEIPERDAERLAGRGRQLAGRTGCGLCGVETIAEVLRPPPHVAATLSVSEDALWRAGAALAERQALNARTRSVHAAAWARADGELAVVREDVGRHNALDKVLGALAREGRDAASGFVVVTSRASYELVQKAATAGVQLLAAVSRPTGLAIRLAEATGMTLVGLLRGESASVYAHAARIVGAP